MTIKEIKETWSKIEREDDMRGKKMFTVAHFSEPIGTSVIMVIKHPDPDVGRYVEAVIQVSTGKDILNGHCRPCDSLDDAHDVASEIIWDNWFDLDIPDEYKNKIAKEEYR